MHMRTQAKAARKRRAMQRQVLYTNPVTPRAGESVQVFYNPNLTVLQSRPDVWMRGSWNRCAAVVANRTLTHRSAARFSKLMFAW